MGIARPSWPRRLAGLGLAGVCAVALCVATTATAAAEGEVLYAGSADAIKDSYVVVFRDSSSAPGVDDRVRSSTARYGGRVNHTFRAALHGYAVTMSETAARRLAADPAVAYVEQDRVVHASRDVGGVQPNPPSWGLDRIDQRDLPLDGGYSFDSAAATVHAYVIDTGIRITHQTFGGRASWGTNTVGDGIDTDCSGHGTHVAGTIGGAQFGVAKGVQLVAVKVLDCTASGSFAGVAAGVDWVTQNAIRPAVANMSLGAAGADAATENAVRTSIASGVTYAIASGNSNADACNFTPARVAEAITVNATDMGDARASFSNFGGCTDIFAPGVNITSAWMNSDTGTNTISGTSMATPHVAGAAALWLAAHPDDPPAAVAAGLIANATPDQVAGAGDGSPNRLLFTNPTAVGTPGAPSLADPGQRSGTVGVATSLQLMASGGAPPYTFAVDGLPPGLTIDSPSGLITGTPATAGQFAVTATVQDAAGQSGSATFSWVINPPSGCSSPGQKIANPGFESGGASWSASAGVVGQWGGQGEPTHGGTWNAWMDGYGVAHTDTVSQLVLVPAGCTASTLTFWLHVDSAESAASAAFDRLTVALGSTTLATYSNLDRGAGYQARSFPVGQFAGQALTLRFTGAEDGALQTSFVLDDITVTAG